MKPKAIEYNIIRKNLKPPPKTKLITFLNKIRKEKFGSEKFNFGALEKWLKECSKIPDIETDPFIVSHEIFIDETNNNSTFRFFVRSKSKLV